MGMSLDRALRVRDHLAVRLQDVYSTAINLKMTHDQLLQRRTIYFFNDPLYKKVPRWVHSYLEGMEKVLNNHLWHHNLVWLMSVDGKLMTGKEIDKLTKQEEAKYSLSNKLSNDYKSPWSRVDGDLSYHCWKDDNGKPLRDKTFYCKK